MEADSRPLLLSARSAPDAPRFVSASVLPKRAMMIYQIRAHLRGVGEVDVLAAPPLQTGLASLDGGPEDPFGNASFSMGAAFLAPFVNRIRGRYDPLSHEIETRIAGQDVRLPANGGGKASGAEQYAIHGLILNLPATDIVFSDRPDGQSARGRIVAGDFGGRWPSRTELEIEVAVTPSAFVATVRATNTGDLDLPMGIGWHPYFNLPSGDRRQARVRLPARSRLPVNDYDEVLPTGEVLPVAGTRFDFSADGGRELGDMYLDDCFVDLEKTAKGETLCEIRDPAAGYGLRVVSDSPEVSALQTFAPPDRPFFVVEPQFSWADPFGEYWSPDVNTGMVKLRPGGTVQYRVRLELFEP